MAKPIGWRRVRRYTPEFKLQAVKLTQVEGVRVGDVAEALVFYRQERSEIFILHVMRSEQLLRRRVLAARAKRK